MTEVVVREVACSEVWSGASGLARRACSGCLFSFLWAGSVSLDIFNCSSAVILFNVSFPCHAYFWFVPLCGFFFFFFFLFFLYIWTPCLIFDGEKLGNFRPAVLDCPHPGRGEKAC